MNVRKKSFTRRFNQEKAWRDVLNIDACVAANTKLFYHDLRLLSVRNSLDNNLLNVSDKNLQNNVHLPLVHLLWSWRKFFFVLFYFIIFFITDLNYYILS